MAGEGNESKQKVKRDRSPNHPVVSLDGAMALAKAMRDKYSSHEVYIHLIREHWDKKKAIGNQLVAALKSYGLVNIEGKADERKVSISDEAHRIIRNAPDHESLIKKAALMPPIHAELWQEKGGESGLAHDDVLRQYLLWERPEPRFNEDAVDGFIEKFKETIAFANLSKSDIMEDEDSNNNEGKSVTAVARPVTDKQQEAVVRDFPIPLMSGGIAVIKVPVPMSEADFAQLTGTLEAWKAALVRPKDEV